MPLDLGKLENVSTSRATGKTTARCPACHEMGDDATGNHLYVNADGAFGCIMHQGSENVGHRRRIAELVGDDSEAPTRDRDDWSRTKPAAPSHPYKVAEKPEKKEKRIITVDTPYDRSYKYLDADSRPIFEVRRYSEPKDFRQFRIENGKAMSGIDGVTRIPYRLPELIKAETVWLVEGEKDADNLVALGFEATCRAAGSSKWEDELTPWFADKHVVLCGDNDAPGQKFMDTVAAKLKGRAAKITRVEVPEPHKDISDALEGLPEAKAKQFVGELLRPKSKLTVKSFHEIYSLHFADDRDCYFGDRMIAEGSNVTLLGPGGVGKSRLVTQLAISMILGLDFLGMPTRAAGKKWLFVQTENSNRRLQNDLAMFVKSMHITPDQYQILGDCLFIHTLETDDDQMLDMLNPKSSAQVHRLIEQTEADIVVFDPLNTMSSGDLNSDQDMRAVITAITSVVKRGNPKRVPMVLHHSLTGKAGAARAVGWDKASYGRNSKALQAWARAQFNLTPRDPDNSDLLLLSGGKNNDGKLLPEIGVIFEGGLYKVDSSFDPVEFRESVGAETPKTNRFTNAEIVEAVRAKPGMKNSDLVKIIMDAGLARQSAYDKIKAAVKAGKITVHATLQTVYIAE